MFWIIIVFSAIAVAIQVWIKIDTEKKQKQAVQKKKVQYSYMNFTRTFEGNGTNTYFLGLDDNGRRGLFVYEHTTVNFAYNDIVSAQIMFNGQYVETQKKMGNTIGKTIVGGALAGDAGAIVGGISGNSNSIGKANCLKVHVVLRNNIRTSFDVICLDGYEFETKGIVYETRYNEAQKIVDALSVIISSNSMTQSFYDTANNTVSHESDVEQLRVLADMYSKELLTEEEFNNMKSKIIQ